jgi:hypothetical protein
MGEDEGWLASIRARAAAEVARRSLEALGDSIADDLEKLLLPDGAPPEETGDALDRLRRQHGLDSSPKNAPSSKPAPPEDALARAKAELAEMKKKLGKS